MKCDYCAEEAVSMIGESNNILVCAHHGRGSEELLDRVTRANKMLTQARQEYTTAVWLASSRGYSNVQIAKAAGKTEAAIRMMLKRKTQQRWRGAL